MKRIAFISLTFMAAATVLFAQAPPIDIPEPDGGTVSVTVKEINSIQLKNDNYLPILHLTPDGKLAMVVQYRTDGSNNWLDFMSVASGNELFYVINSRFLGVTAEGSMLCIRPYWGEDTYTQIDKKSGKTKKINIKDHALIFCDSETGNVGNWSPLKVDSRVEKALLSGNGSRLALKCEDNTLRVLSSKDMKEVTRYRDIEGFIDFNINPDGSILAACSPDHLVKIWDAKVNKLITSLDAHGRGDIVQVIFSPDGKYLASADKQGKIIIWNTSTWKSARTITIDTTKDSFINGIAFSPDGKLLAVAQDNQRDGTYYYRNRIQLWAAASGEKVYEIKLPETAYDAVKAVTFSSDGKTMAALSYGYDYDATKGSQQWRYKLYFWRISSEVVAAPDAAMLRIKVQDAISQNKLGEAEKLAKEVVSLDSGSAESQSLYGEVLCKEMKFAEATSAINEAMRIDPANAEKYKAQIKKIQEDQQAHEKARIDRENAEKQRQSYIATNTSESKLQSNKDVWTRFDRSDFCVFSPNGKKLASVFRDTISLWDVSTRQKLLEFGRYTVSLSFSPDGKTLAGGAGNGRITIWDTSTGKKKIILDGGDYAGSVSYSPDGKMLASAHINGSVILWNIATGKQIRTFKGPETSGNEHVCFSPDGKQLVSSYGFKDIRIWDVKTGKAVRTFNLDARAFFCLSPDGKTLACGNYNDSLIKLWDVSTGELIQSIKRPKDKDFLLSVAFSPDGKLLAGGIESEPYFLSGNLWNVATGEWIGALNELGGMNEPSFSPDGRSLVSGETLIKLEDDISATKR